MAEFAQSFEELWIWQQARELVKQSYADFGKGSPSEYDFSFRSQIQRAAVSIMNNIAEGFERKAQTEFRRFLDIAKSSCAEVRSMYYTAEYLEYVSSETANMRREFSKQLSAGIASMMRSLKK
jgi:four helix bundle protein